MISEFLKKPHLLMPKKHIILMSHMRANTTLLGHIFGSHPDMSGYYEHHIGYYSWKSLIRQKIKFSYENPYEPVTKFYFDKILHNERPVSEKVWDMNNVSLLFMLRKPERTIKSIIKLYQRIEPNHKLVSTKFAAEYYINRLCEISTIAKSYSEKKKVFYLDSEVIVENTEKSLEEISNWFSLNPKLCSEYKLFELSGKVRHGDSSENIKNGYVNKNKTSYEDIEIEKELLEMCLIAYERNREIILNISHRNIVLD